MSITTAVVGGGTVSDWHLDGLTRLPEADLVAICDLDEDRVRQKAREYDLKAYTDVEAMLVREELDWLHICTPVQTHLELAKTAIESDVAVQIEKPVTETAEEAEELLRHAERYDVPVSVVHQHDYDPAMREARERIERGEIGEVRSAEMLYAGETWPDEEKRGSWALDLAGGEFEEGLPHPIYMLLNLGGYPESPEAITADTDRHRHYEQGFDYDGTSFQYRSEDGALCSGTILASPVPHKELRIHGNDGSLVVDVVSQTVTALDRDYESSSLGRAMANVDHVIDRVRGTVENAMAVAQRARSDDWETHRDLNAHAYQFDREARALLGDAPMPDTLAEARWTIEIMEEIRASAGPEEAPATASPAEHQAAADQD